MNKGILKGVAAYTLWGLFPIYWKMLHQVPAVQVIGNRIVWSFLLLAGIMLFTRQWTNFRTASASPRIVGIYSIAAVLLTINWLVYVWGVNSGMNCQAPDEGNMHTLLHWADDEQKEKYLRPLCEGYQMSCFAMTEPEVAGSDPTLIQTRAYQDGDEWVINGHKWFTSNGHAADFYIVMCRTGDPDDRTGATDKMTQIIVPKNTPGVNIVRGVPVWGRASSHCEIIYDNVRVPKENQLGRTGTGHQAAQDRLGAGRVYHCMNSIGSMWRAFDLMVERAMTREVHGGERLEDKQFIQGYIAESYIDIQSLRCYT